MDQVRAFATENLAVIAVGVLSFKIAERFGFGALGLYAGSVFGWAVTLHFIRAAAAAAPKIHGSRRQPPPSWARSAEALARTFLLACTAEAAMAWCALHAAAVRGADGGADAGGADASVAGQLLRLAPVSFVWEVLFDFGHYWAHRLCHESPWLYRHVHKAHHRFLHPSALTTAYFSLADVALTNLGPSLLAFAAVPPMSPLQVAVLLAYKRVIEIAGHSGMDSSGAVTARFHVFGVVPLAYFTCSLPQLVWLGRALNIETTIAAHDLHHSYPGFACNFASRLSLWDRVFGTYKDPHELGDDAPEPAPVPPSGPPVVFSAVINLVERPDRLAAFQAAFRAAVPSELLFGRRLHCFRTRRHPEGGRVGCFDSHLRCYALALDAGADAALIFEDDVALSQGFSERRILAALEGLRRAGEPWHVIRLCPNGLIQRFDRVAPGLVRSLQFGNRAYLVSREMMAHMLEEGVHDALQVDVALTSHTGRAFTLHPAMARCVPMGSDNDSWEESPVLHSRLAQRLFGAMQAIMRYTTALETACGLLALHARVPLGLLLLRRADWPYAGTRECARRLAERGP